MNLLASVLLSVLEKHLAEAAPEIAEVTLNQLKLIGNEVVMWAEKKLNYDINGDGKIGDDDGKSS